MPHLTCTLGADGPTLRVLVGLTGATNTSLFAAAKPIPPPLLVTALIDTGTNVTIVAPRILRSLGVQEERRLETQTVAGSVWVPTYKVSLGIPRFEDPKNPVLVLSELEVMELPQALDVEVLIGRDVLKHLLLVWDGQRGEFTLAD